jgi:nucleosome binding factor SPN SPT16 subunit
VVFLPENINKMSHHQKFRHNPHEAPKVDEKAKKADWQKSLTSKQSDDKLFRMIADGSSAPQKKHPYPQTCSQECKLDSLLC